MEDNYRDVCYQSSNLKQVILKIDFPNPVENDKIFGESIDKKIVEYFSIRGKDEIKYYNEVSVAADSKTGMVKGHTTRFEGIEKTYIDTTRMNKIVLSNDTIIFTYNNYQSFEKLFEAASGILQQIWKNKKLIAVRCGLRYINLYNLLPTDKKVSKTMFSPKLSIVMTASLIDEQELLKPIRSMVTTEYVADDIKVTYRAGIYNQFYPMPISKDDYALDIDCYTNSAIESAEDLERFIERAHGMVQMLFEKSINDKMRGVMMKDEC